MYTQCHTHTQQSYVLTEKDLFCFLALEFGSFVKIIVRSVFTSFDSIGDSNK